MVRDSYLEKALPHIETEIKEMFINIVIRLSYSVISLVLTFVFLISLSSRDIVNSALSEFARRSSMHLKSTFWTSIIGILEVEILWVCR